MQLCSLFFWQEKRVWILQVWTVCGVTLEVANKKHSLFTNTRMVYLHQEMLEELIWWNFCSTSVTF